MVFSWCASTFWTSRLECWNVGSIGLLDWNVGTVGRYRLGVGVGVDVAVCGLLFAVCGSRFAVCCLLFVVCCLLFALCCLDDAAYRELVALLVD
jgi:hypothetical protein